MADYMVSIYVSLIRKKLKKLDDVPSNIREEVEKALNGGG